jgi:hypothetical protein
MKLFFAAAQQHSVSREESNSARMAQITSAGNKTSIRSKNIQLRTREDNIFSVAVNVEATLDFINILHSYHLYLQYIKKRICSQVGGRIRFSAEKPRRLQVSPGHLLSAAFRIRPPNAQTHKKTNPKGLVFF